MHSESNPDYSYSPPRHTLVSMPALIAFVIPALFLVFLGTRFNIDIEETWEQLRESNLTAYAMAVIAYYSSFLVRGLRWRIIVNNTNRDRVEAIPVSSMHCARLILLGWFVNTIAWFRLGDAYRAYAFSQDTGLRFSQIFGTVLAERVIDSLVVFLLLSLGSATLMVIGTVQPHPVFLIVACLLALSVGVLLFLMKYLGVPLARLLPDRLAAAYERLYRGTMSSFGNLPTLGLLSLIAWLLEATRLFLVVTALGLSMHPLLVLCIALISALLTTVPITPGGLGFVEAGAGGLLSLQLSTSMAVSVIILDRSISYLSIILTGGLVFTLRQLQKRRASMRTPIDP